MNTTAQRLHEGAAALEALDRVRTLTGDRVFGLDDEYAIVIAELWDLEEEMIANPAAFELSAVRVRQKDKGQK